MMASLHKSLVRHVDREGAMQSFWCLVYASAIVAVYVAALERFM